MYEKESFSYINKDVLVTNSKNKYKLQQVPSYFVSRLFLITIYVQYTEVLLLILEDILVLLHNKTGSYSFVQNAQALNLKHIHVRENATDNTRYFKILKLNTGGSNIALAFGMTS
jgi:hypothetical protein